MTEARSMAAGVLLTILALNLTRPQLDLDQSDTRIVLITLLAVGLLVVPDLVETYRRTKEQ